MNPIKLIYETWKLAGQEDMKQTTVETKWWEWPIAAMIMVLALAMFLITLPFIIYENRKRKNVPSEAK